MRVVVTSDLERFAADAAEFVTADVRRNVIATTLAGVEAGDYQAATFALGYADGDPSRTETGAGTVVAAAIRTPPRHMLAAGFDDPAAATALIEQWHAIDPDLTGVSGEPATAAAISAAWAARTGQMTEIEYAEALHVLTNVVPPERPAAGHLRRAADDDVALVGEWGRAFVRETGFGDESAIETTMARRIALGTVYVWDDGGEPVTLAAHAIPIAGTARVGPIYTPSELRGRGYATVATAALSERLLADGAERCMLYTDLANPISNHVYAKIGYVRLCDWEERGFIGPSRDLRSDP